MKIVDNEIVFSSGRREYAYDNIVGISPDLWIYYGYDGNLSAHGWTEDERRELAEYMIDLWTQYKNKRNDQD